MERELKIRIDDVESVERRLIRIGAEFDSELRAKDTYFKQPAGKILKIVEDDRGSFLTRLVSSAGGFEIVERRTLVEAETTKSALEQQYGIHRTLVKRRRIYKYRGDQVELNLIENVGDFLILVSADPQESLIEDELGIIKPEYIRVPFSEL